MKRNLSSLIEQLLIKAESIQLVNPRNKTYFWNHLHNIFNIPITYPLSHTLGHNNTQYDLTEIELYSIAEQIFLQLDGNQLDNLGKNKEQVIEHIIDELLPLPSSIEMRFEKIYHDEGIKSAMNWFYRFNRSSTYIKTHANAKNSKWIATSVYGELRLIIDLAKPKPHHPQEKSNNRHYPPCELCIENEGFAGNESDYSSFYTNRMLRLELAQQEWYFQYVAYAYYPEQANLIHPLHQNKANNSQTLETLFAFVDKISHYTIAADCDLPQLSNDISTHKHYLVANHTFPLEYASVKSSFNLTKYPQINLEYLFWPITTLRLIGDKLNLVNITKLITQTWLDYSDNDLNIFANSANGTKHNAVALILRKLANEEYSLYLTLRNNAKSEKYPNGIFAPRANLQHIKQTNIGLSETMGIALLPARLAYELSELKQLLLHNDEKLALTELLFDEALLKHEQWLSQLYQQHKIINLNTVDNILQQATGDKFCQMLEQCAVFKHDPQGDLGLTKFIAKLELNTQTLCYN